MGRIFRRLKQLRFPSFARGDYSVESERSIENTDAFAATINPNPQGPGHATFPPNYVKTDDGRPRH